MRPLYVSSLETLQAARKPVPWWRAKGLVPLLNIQSGFNPYHPEARAAIEPTVQAIAALAPPGFLIFLGCYSPDLPGPLTLLPEPAWQVLLGNLRALGESLRRHLGGGVCVDLEYYPATGGGPMPKGTWPAAPGTEARGAAFARALGPALSLGLMVWAQELTRQPGLASFARGAYHALGASRSLFLSEDYVGGADPKAAKALGAGRVLSGAWAKPGKKVPGSAGWIWDPQGVLLK